MKLWLICFWGLFLAVEGWQWLGLKVPAEALWSLAVGLAGMGLAIASNRPLDQRPKLATKPADQAAAAPTPPAPVHPLPAAPNVPATPVRLPALSFEIQRKPRQASPPAPQRPAQNP